MKLISNTLFGDYCKSRKEEFKTNLEYLVWYENTRTKYDNFLKQLLELWMFVPCDEDGNVLEEPKWDNEDIKNPYHYYLKGLFGIPHPTSEIDLKARKIIAKCKKYHQAKERCLFEGFEVFEDMYHSTKRKFVRNKSKILTSIYNRFEYHTGEIETSNPLFINHKSIEDLIKYDLILTPTAIKQIGL